MVVDVITGRLTDDHQSFGGLNEPAGNGFTFNFLCQDEDMIIYYFLKRGNMIKFDRAKMRIASCTIKKSISF